MTKNATDAAVVLTDVTKVYAIHHEKPTLVEKFIKKKEELFVALNHMSLVIRKGERIGIIGTNGSGKTTLLKVIAGITTPTSGVVKTEGRIVSLIDFQAGFHPDLTGYQNIFLNGMLLGIKKQELNRILPEIIAFADIGRFIDTPLFTYSEGMKLRLGFSVAVHADPDILILDEGLSAGDAKFQKKAMEKIQSFFRMGKTIIVVSHWLRFIENNCSTVYIIKNGKIHQGGEAKKLIRAYERSLS